MIRPRTAELAALERLKNFHRLIMGENLVSTLAPSFFDRIFFILAGNEDNHKSLDKF